MTPVALRNPIAVAMMCLAMMILSVVLTPRLSVDSFPELTPPVLLIATQVPGMGPKDVEKTISWRIEKFASATPGVDRVTSVSRQDLSMVFVWLKWGTPIDTAQILVRQQVDFAVSSIPKTLGVVPPFVLQYDPANAPVLQLTVTGGGLTGPQLYDFAMNVVAPRIEGISGVASAAPNGGRERQINVTVDPARAEALGVTASEVSQAVANANALLPSGRLLAAGFEANVYTNALPNKVQDIGDAVVKVVNGRPVYIRDVALVADGGTRATQYVSVNGEPAVYLNVLRVPGGNVIQIVDEVKRTVAGLEDLPPGLKVESFFDQSIFVRSSYTGLKHEVVRALFLVAAVILFFLQSPRAVLIACFAVPISFGLILVVLSATGQTLNAFTLGGLTLVMGPLVDISVVVLEAIHRELDRKKPPVEAALDGARSVAVPALSAILCTMAVLVPVVLLEGLAKRLFVPLALTYATGIVGGYVVAMAVTPVACRYLLGGHPAEGTLSARLAHAGERVVLAIRAAYLGALRRVLDHRVALATSAAVLVAGAGAATTLLPSSFFPEIDEAMECVYVRFAPGTSLDEASRKLDEMGTLLKDKLPAGSVEVVLANVGTPTRARAAIGSPNAGSHMGFLRLGLSDPEHRATSQREIADASRALLAEAYPGVDFLQAPGGMAASVFASGYLAPVVVEIKGDDLQKLEADARAVAEVARTVGGVRDVYVGFGNDYPEVRVDTDRALAGQVGVSARQAAQTALEATAGNVNTPGVWIDGQNGQTYYVVTSLDERAVSDVVSLKEAPVRAATNAAITLGTYGSVDRREGPGVIDRAGLGRVALVYMQTEGRDIGTAAAELEAKLATAKETREVKARFVGQVELMRGTFGGMKLALGLSVLAVFMILASLFRSLRLPFVLLFSVPGAAIGVVLALVSTGQGLSIISLMGVLMVVDIAVANGILLVDHAETLRRGGVAVRAAIEDAGRARFVPIVMTSLATICGLAPGALGLEKGTESMRPLALAVVGGLATATFLSLFLVPVVYSWIAPEPKPEPQPEQSPEPEGDPSPAHGT